MPQPPPSFNVGLDGGGGGGSKGVAKAGGGTIKGGGGNPRLTRRVGSAAAFAKWEGLTGGGGRMTSGLHGV
eukprot:253645-Amphidinium_carterae.1